MGVKKGEAQPQKQIVSDEEVIEGISTLGTYEFARKVGMDIRSLQKRRQRIEMRQGIIIRGPNSRRTHFEGLDKHPAVVQLGIENGHVLIGSDAHYWPGIVPTAHNAFLEFCREFKPKVIVLNGDEFDFPSISRWAPIGWESRPKIWEEIENTKAMMSEIEKVSPTARHINPLSNHSARFETRLATVAPEYAKVYGVHLKDHIPAWEPCWECFINNDVVVKHRLRSGIYAPRNNTLNSGRTIITGHLHSQKMIAVSDYNGTRWGVDAGCMADIWGPQFYNYTETSCPLDWRSGFCMLTFVKGRLLMPELIWVSGRGEVQFRGEVIHV